MNIFLRVRARLSADDEFIYELGSRAFAEYARDPGRHTLALALRATTFVADDGVRPVGFVIVDPPEGGIAHVSALAVTEEARGRGIGRSLLRAAERLAREQGARRLALVTADSNLAALDLFLQRGFRRTSTARPYPRGQLAVRLEKRL